MRVARRLLAGLALLATAALTAAMVLAWHQGYRAYIVHTGSMIPTLRPGEAVVDRPARWPVHRGEIITFRYAYGPDQVVTHRVFSGTGGAIEDQGATPTPPRTPGRCGAGRWSAPRPRSSRTAATAWCT